MIFRALPKSYLYPTFPKENKAKSVASSAIYCIFSWRRLQRNGSIYGYHKIRESHCVVSESNARGKRCGEIFFQIWSVKFPTDSDFKIVWCGFRLQNFRRFQGKIARRQYKVIYYSGEMRLLKHCDTLEYRVLLTFSGRSKSLQVGLKVKKTSKVKHHFFALQKKMFRHL